MRRGAAEQGLGFRVQAPERCRTGQRGGTLSAREQRLRENAEGGALEGFLLDSNERSSGLGELQHAGAALLRRCGTETQPGCCRLGIPHADVTSNAAEQKDAE